MGNLCKVILTPSSRLESRRIRSRKLRMKFFLSAGSQNLAISSSSSNKVSLPLRDCQNRQQWNRVVWGEAQGTSPEPLRWVITLPGCVPVCKEEEGRSLHSYAIPVCFSLKTLCFFEVHGILSHTLLSLSLKTGSSLGEPCSQLSPTIGFLLRCPPGSRSLTDKITLGFRGNSHS